MPVMEMDNEQIDCEVVRRAVNLYIANVRCWNTCVEKAVDSVLLEMDYWMVWPLKNKLY